MYFKPRICFILDICKLGNLSTAYVYECFVPVSTKIIEKIESWTVTYVLQDVTCTVDLQKRTHQSIYRNSSKRDIIA